MKKIQIILILVVLILTSIACGSSTGGDTVAVNEEESIADVSPTLDESDENERDVQLPPTDEGQNDQEEILEEEEPAPTPTEETVVSVEEQVLFDQDGIVITLKSLSFEGWYGPSLKVIIENNSSKDITVQTRNVAINDVMVEGMFSSEVAVGKKANDEISFSSSDLEEANIELIKTIEFKLIIFESETYDTLYETDPLLITTSADPSYVQTYNDSGFVALERDGIKVVVQKLDSEDSFWGADIYVYIENNSPNDITVQLRDVSINGFMVEPIFSSDVLSGKKAYDSITFFESDLEDNGITDIEELALYFHVYELDGWDTIFDSEIITISFAE